MIEDLSREHNSQAGSVPTPGSEFADQWAPSITIETPQEVVHGFWTITYTVVDPDNDLCTVQFQYSPDGGASWYDCTPGSGGDGITNLTSSHLGVEHTFIWDTNADNLSPFDIASNIMLRALVSDGTLDSEWSSSDPFSADNSIGNTAPVASVTSPSGTQKGNISFPFLLADAEGHACDIVIKVTLDSGATYQVATAASGSCALTNLATDPDGVEYTFIWDSVADGAGADYPLQAIYRLQIALTDNRDSGTTVFTDYFKVDNIPSGTFITIDSMDTPRYNHAGVKLLDGTVLLVGGQQNTAAPEDYFNDAEIYDPDTATFSTLASTMGIARTQLRAVLMANGKVLISGGQDDSNVYASAHIYDPASGSFTVSNNDMTESRYNHASVLLDNGNVLVTGGNNGVAVTGSANLFNPSTGTFAAAANMKIDREGHFAIKLNTGQVLVIGGYSGVGGYLSTAELYDPVANTFTYTLNSLGAAGWLGSGCMLDDGSIFFSGGRSAAAQVTASASKYDIVTANFVNQGLMLTQRCGHSTTLLPDGKVFIFGGFDSTDFASDPFGGIFDPSNSSYANLTSDPLSPRSLHSAIMLNDGKILLAGGVQNGVIMPPRSEIYVP